MKINPVKGTYDYNPRESEIRDYLTNTILGVYKKYGFERIITPAIEDAENIDKSDGGDNLNLVFKILKRGDKLQKALLTIDEKELSDLGLRYDLTLPLSRYVANNRSNILMPFKVIQIGSVYRAERPQKGRLREFIQCDIDVMGSKSPNIEVELLHVASEALIAIGLKKFTINVNDRRILRSWLLALGFSEESLDSVSISFDKLDKIGLDGVVNELKEKGFNDNAIGEFKKSLEYGTLTLEKMENKIKDVDILSNLKYIIEKSNDLCQNNMKNYKDVEYKIIYNPSLVRGQGYYTGTVFEIVSDEFKGAISGGGRYDNLIGKFIKEDIPAVGISIGFERIFSILMDKGFEIPNNKKKVALIYSKDSFMDAFIYSNTLRDKYEVSLYEKPKKFGPYLDKLKDKGYFGFINFDNTKDISELS